MKTRSKSQLYQLYVLVVGIILICAIVAGTTWGVLYYCNYHEEAIACEDFLDKPDGITVHYVEDGHKRSKKLTNDEIDLVFAAFESMIQNCVSANTFSYGHVTDATTYKEDRFEKGGDVEFYYKKRRSVDLSITAPDYDPRDSHKSHSYYSFCGEFDSLSIAYMDKNNLRFYGCLNNHYYRTYNASVTFSQEAADNFWSVVRSCI